MTPGPGTTPIPINYANGPSRWDADVRFSRTWGWGEKRNVAAATVVAAGWVDLAAVDLAAEVPAAAVVVARERWRWWRRTWRRRWWWLRRRWWRTWRRIGRGRRREQPPL